MTTDKTRYDAFLHVHPLITLVFFTVIIVMTCLILHPLSLLLSGSSAIVCLSIHSGVATVIKKANYLIPTMLMAMLINSLFSHAGATILWYFPSGNPLTLESILYGLYAGSLIVCVVLWFSYFHLVMTTDKFVYLFGKISPSLSLLLSMSLRFVPRFVAQLKAIQLAQETLGYSTKVGTLRVRLKNSIRVLSILVTWALENAIDTADSMKSRGYGVGKRTHFHLYQLTPSDKRYLSFVLVVSIGCLWALFTKAFHFTYFPMVQARQTVWSIPAWLLYMSLLSFPIGLNGWERYIWHKKIILK